MIDGRYREGVHWNPCPEWNLLHHPLIEITSELIHDPWDGVDCWGSWFKVIHTNMIITTSRVASSHAMAMNMIQGAQHIHTSTQILIMTIYCVMYHIIKRA